MSSMQDPSKYFLCTDCGLKHFKQAVQSAQSLQQWPLRWDESSDLPKVATSARPTLSWVLNAILCTSALHYLHFALSV